MKIILDVLGNRLFPSRLRRFLTCCPLLLNLTPLKLTQLRGLEAVLRDFDAIYNRLQKCSETNSPLIQGGIAFIFTKMGADSLHTDRLFHKGPSMYTTLALR